MKLIIDNFGPVSSFEFDSDIPMHLIVGTNNIGKSYALTAYYIAVSSLLECRFRMAEIFSEIELFEEELQFDKKFEKTLSTEIEKDKLAPIDVKDYFSRIAVHVLQYTLAEVFNEKIISSYSDFKAILNQDKPDSDCTVTFILKTATVVLKNTGEGFNVSEVTYKHKIISAPEKSKRPQSTFAVRRKLNDPFDKTLAHLRSNGVAHALACVMMPTESIRGIYYLPASRSGLYQALSSFGPIIAELTKKRSLFKSKIELPGISGQLSDYYIKLTEINEKNHNPNSFYDEIVNNIEKDILHGSITFDSSTKKLFYTPNGTNLKLELSATSSMVSELGPVVAYLRFILSQPAKPDKRIEKYLRVMGQKVAEPKHILIIEEPEAHLHPENQIKIIETYTKLAGYDVNVILTSHSNYIFNKLSNLIIAKSILPENVKCDLFNKTEEGTINIPLETTELGIDDLNFTDASEQLINEKMDLLCNMDFSDDQPNS
ncbi:hypothetical protein PS925_03839 [Pseudomonas fluorescens]|uniref:Endonuclease GajA/Old nuclease/RecF-like AAA domain-containing protein n=1 Tax=Pseudomonas fluorescens TaxID=294 RepID=A0A5E7V291_PSEFL|nr:AAA family ATPase [Pseudomonas fluorescens]VVQ13944.1 hypothetical protein PS925_03839 [Pseudomonas fluorescens]